MYVSSAPCLLRVVSIIVTSRRLRRYIQIIPLLVLMSSAIRSTVCWSCYDLLIQHVNVFNSSNYHNNTSTITVASITVSIQFCWCDRDIEHMPLILDFMPYRAWLTPVWCQVRDWINRIVMWIWKFKFNRESGSSEFTRVTGNVPLIFLVVKRDTHNISHMKNSLSCMLHSIKEILHAFP